MKKLFCKIAKDNGYSISDYKTERSDMGMVCFEFMCDNGNFRFTHHCSYAFGASKHGGKTTIINIFKDRLKSTNPLLF
jgi:hypothetical protein